MSAAEEPTPSLYERDFHAWTIEQAALLARGELAHADLPNLIEEIESMGKQQQAELTNRLAVLLAHLLKWQHQPALRAASGRSGRLTVKEQRQQIARHMRKNSSLQAYVPEAMLDAYADAVVIAARESGLAEDVFPERCPLSFEQAMRNDWMPE